MSWKQTLSPNLDTDPNNPLYIWINGQILTDWYGWCLAVVAGSFGAKGSSYSAKTAWQSCWSKHYDRNIPEKVWTPLWYEGDTYGHVVIGYREGNQLTVYSSPYTHKPNFEIFKGELNYILDYIGRVYGVGSFTGWSESVLDSRVIEWEEPVVEKTVEKPVINPQPVENPPEPTTEPEPVTEQNNNNNNEKENNMSTPESVPEQDQQEIASIIEQASSWIKIPAWAKVIAYIVGDIFIFGGVIVPGIINCMQAPDLTSFGAYLSDTLTKTGVYILLVFKLIKKK